MSADYTKLNHEKYARFGQSLADPFGMFRFIPGIIGPIRGVGSGKRSALAVSGTELILLIYLRPFGYSI